MRADEIVEKLNDVEGLNDKRALLDELVGDFLMDCEDELTEVLTQKGFNLSFSSSFYHPHE